MSARKQRTAHEEALHRINVLAQQAEVADEHAVARALWEVAMNALKARARQ